MKMLQESGADAVVPVVPFAYPPLRGLIIDENEHIAFKWPEHAFVRSQDLPAFYHDSGQFYIVKTAAFLQEKTLFCRNTIPMILPETEVQDIDNETDWKIAELKYRVMLEELDEDI